MLNGTLPTIQAIVRVHSKYGDKSARNKARMKFLVAKLGIEEFARRVGEERAALPHDPRWDGFLDEALARADGPAHPPGRDPGPSPSPDFLAWRRTNVTPQKQPGYAVVAVTLPLGDLSASQLRALADVARRYVGDNVRLTSEQNLVLRWVRESDLGALYTDLCALGLGQPGAGTIVDITACPGTDTCRLGISSSRGLAAELRTRLLAQNLAFDEAVGGLSIKISGCFNSCGRHHVADLGFYGSSRTLGGHVAPHFMVVLGGTERGNAESFGLPLGSIPSKNIPDVVERITTRFRRERQNGESFQAFAARLGKKELKAMLDDLKELRDFEVSSEPYRDWGDARLFSLDDMMNTEGPGPPAVRRAQLELAAADRLAWQAQLELEAGAYEQVATTAYAAMLAGARALVHLEDGLIEHPDAIVERFRARFVETGLFAANGAGRFAHYLLSRHASPLAQPDAETAREEVHRAQLFLEAAHACYGRLAAASNHLQSAGVP
ncbi:nitrite/sulfite reductase [bacterium]|nr:nitrite/sulfite reductase [bacterium]